MNTEWVRLKDIFGDAIELPPQDRAAFLAKACAGDAKLQAAVEQLLSNTNTQTGELLAPQARIFSAGELITPRFRITRFLGEGGMGEVYEVQDLELGGLVALKTLRQTINNDARFLARFRREVQMARQVTHPNVCRIFDVGSASPQGVPLVFLTMELLDGRSLFEFLRKQSPFTEEAAMPLLRNMLEGLGALHAQGIIHRDFKPANVMIVSDRTGSARAVITDFGLARDLESDGAHTQTGTFLMGTPSYMAPEQFKGQPATPQSDIYSLGIVMHELLTGRKPFPPPQSAEAASSAPTMTLPAIQIAEGLSPRLQALILRCIAFNPSERPQSTAEILDGLSKPFPAPSEQPLLAARAETVPAGARVPNPTRRWAAAAACALLVGAAAFGTWTKFFQESPVPKTPPAPSRLVAVIPFQAINEDDRELRALSDGVAEMLASKLTEVELLQGGSFSVVPASEIRSRKIDSVDSARKQYGVNLAVTGSIQRVGKSIQFTANLVDAAELRQLRATSFEAAVGDGKALRDGVISRVIGMLDVPSTPQLAKALEGNETGRATAYFAYLEGRGYLYRFDIAGNVERAIESLGKAVQDDPDYALAHAALGEAYWRKARSMNDKVWAGRALESAQKAVQLGGSLAVPHIKLGEIYGQSGRQQDAIREFQLALKSQPGNAEAYRGLGSTYVTMGLFKEAEEAYLQSARLRPNDWYSHNLLGVFYYGQGNYAKTEQSWLRAQDLTPDNEYPCRNLGLLYLGIGKFEQAKREFDRSNSIKPSFLARQGLGRLHYYADRPAQAVVEFQKATEIEPYNHLGWGGLGDAYSQIPGKADEARKAYARAVDACERKLAVSPKADETRAYLALYHALLHQKAKALEILAQVIDAPALNIDARTAVAFTHEVLGERQMAIRGFETLLSDARAVTLIRADPLLRQLKEDPGFAPLLQRRSAL